MFSDRSHVILLDISNFHAYQKMIQEQMMHENKIHDMNFPALVTSTRVPKVKKVIDNGCLFFFGDQHADDDDDVAADIATADEDEDETSFSCVAGFSCGSGCGHEHDVGFGGKLGGGKLGGGIKSRNDKTTTSTKTTTNNRTNKRIMIKRNQSSVVEDLKGTAVGVLGVGTNERLSVGVGVGQSVKSVRFRG